jgi:uncharacterized RDD family membrane protein YckC
MIGTIGGGSGSPPPPPAPPPVGPNLVGPLGFARYASFGRRVGAYLIDGVPALIIAAIGYSALFAAVVGRTTSGLSLSLVVLFVGPIIYFVILWLMAAKGNSPGNAILGIRVVRESDGSEPGVGLGLGRLLLKGLLIGITFYIGGFSPLWDKTGRRKGWWDSACSTVVLDRDAVPEYRAAVAGGQPPSLAAMSMAGLPEPPREVGDATADPAWERPAPIDDRPPWDLPPPVPGPNRSSAVPASGGPAASWGDRPVGAAPLPPAPAAALRSASAPDPVDEGSWSDPSAAASVIQAVPGFGSSTFTHGVSNRGPVPDPVGHTRMRVAPHESSAEWRADLDDGRRLVLAGPTLLGRDPSGEPSESSAVTIPIVDEGRSVSKTHLLLDIGPAGVQVTDRYSTNGVVVVTAGVELACVPGVATPVPAGSTVRFGDRSLVIHRS